MRLIECVKKVYENMPDEFDGLNLLKQVRELSGRMYVYDSTVLRYLRELREKGKINYSIVDRKRSRYKKLSYF